ncbi:MAG: hypothetical protein JRD47_00715 [Deltaproteobacteria bacterium]|nr:hypothetical protein [Deltaproteobacteria bacterium]MBW2264981.1 hypothetical protein [Deltaproteobacteria bacterium]MBW2317097.1 hypothetical protein [Deltaproteobacteria bacterium]MBW2600440.1 hypothetical protein [Deltaproteobacteria bacterium]OEU46592.1 MAG: hypothetical protein BBJ60_06375 [Desulfobacterales bacterium S7086C20]
MSGEDGNKAGRRELGSREVSLGALTMGELAAFFSTATLMYVICFVVGLLFYGIFYLLRNQILEPVTMLLLIAGLSGLPGFRKKLRGKAISAG